ncbi:hypothetical protein RJ639_045160 [Escallonia herrerae]|uniref:DUF1664 domain-containing protein n=1 Tax=Escallonia herrerae TaxID=1293975 RepID=A0AA88W8N0_9ASTE|nr:hypothetical protein RJ639_045160 [Escallonia herrerae]
MAMQTGIATSKVLILVGAGLTGSVILRSGQLSELISQLQELTKGVNDAEISPGKYDAALLMAQIQKLAQEIRELTVSGPVTIFNGNSSSSVFHDCWDSLLSPAFWCRKLCFLSVASCSNWGNGILLHVVEGKTLQLLGLFVGWSFSDVMFVTKHNMANAVANVSKQLEHVHESLALTKKHLTKKLESLDWKLDEQKETSKLIANDVNEAKASLNQIGYDIEIIHQMVSGMEGKLEVLEGKQDMTNSGLWYLCQAAGGIKDERNATIVQGIGAKLIDQSTVTYEEQSLKGLQFIAETNESSAVEKLMINTGKKNLGDSPAKSFPKIKAKIYRPYPVGLSLTRDILGSDS